MVGPLDVARIVLGSVYVLFLPGLAWSFALFPRQRAIDDADSEGLDWIERGAIAFGLSIALVPTAVFLLSFFLHVRLTTANAVLIVLALTIAPLAYVVADHKKWLPWRRRAPTPADDPPPNLP